MHKVINGITLIIFFFLYCSTSWASGESKIVTLEGATYSNLTVFNNSFLNNFPFKTTNANMLSRLSQTIDPNTSDNSKMHLKPLEQENPERLWSQTKLIFGLGFGVIGVIAMLPEDISQWDDLSEVGGKWKDNVTQAPVWDSDVWYLNYIGHPYFGGVYYQVARNSGYDQWHSFLYSAAMSTFYWEYGIEAFAERPSFQDLIITPVGGWLYGEWAHKKEWEIRNQGNVVLGSETLGSISLALLDPVGSIARGLNNLTNSNFIVVDQVTFSETTIPSISSSYNWDRENNQFNSGTHYATLNLQFSLN